MDENIIERLAEVGQLGDYCATLALGTASSPERRSWWLQDNQKPLEDLDRRVRNLFRKHTSVLTDPLEIRGLHMAMRASANGRADEGGLEAPQGRPGEFAHGPYVPLLPGLYKLACEYRHNSNDLTALALGIEVVNQDVLFAAGRLVPVEITSDKFTCSFEFAIGPEARALPRKSEFEFRLVSNGLHAVSLVGMSLTRAPAADWKDEGWNLLPLMSLSRPTTTDFHKVTLQGPGHALFGLYRKLIPGSYELAVRFSGTTQPVGISIEVLNRAIPVSNFAVRLTDQGLDLNVPLKVEDMDALYEFRISLDKPSAVTLERLALRALVRDISLLRGRPKGVGGR
jgi:hypothetical protein